MQIKLSVIATELGKSLDAVSAQVARQLRLAVRQLSLNAYSEAQRLANQKLHSAQSDYLNGLKFQDLSDQNIYVIYLDDNSSAVHFERGWTQFDQKPGLLNGPSAKVSASGVKYNTIPFRKKGTANEGSPKAIIDTASAIQKIIKDNKLEKIVKDIKGGTMTTYKGIQDSNLQGLTRITQQYQTKTGKGGSFSQYFVFRRISENSDPSKFIHPGYAGAHVFVELQKYVESNMRNILMGIL
jgi:hypothetical protein